MVFEIHRLHNLGWKVRKIARKLRASGRRCNATLKIPNRERGKYPAAPSLIPIGTSSRSFLKKIPKSKPRWCFNGPKKRALIEKITILRNFLMDLREQQMFRTSYVRIESPPGKQMQADWGHFGSIRYGDTMRRLYALALTPYFHVKYFYWAFQSSW